MEKAINKRPDFKDSFSPKRGSKKLVRCLHCGDVYPENEVFWDVATVCGSVRIGRSAMGEALVWTFIILTVVFGEANKSRAY